LGRDGYDESNRYSTVAFSQYAVSGSVFGLTHLLGRNRFMVVAADHILTQGGLGWWTITVGQSKVGILGQKRVGAHT
jgi:hypothetical protein